MQTIPGSATGQLDLGFIASYQTIPCPGKPNTFLVEVSTRPQHGEELLYLKQVAKELTLSVRWVQRLCETGELQSCIPGREHRRVKRRWLDDYKRARGMI